MSSDFEQLISDPLSLRWQANQESNAKQRYRELDAPLTKYIIGFGRSIIGLPPLSVDWNWSKTWDENRKVGALPDSQLLGVSRLSITLLMPISLIFVYLSAQNIAGSIAGLTSVIYLGLSALILTHTRRAMAEGALLFSISFFIWSLSKGVKHPWITGLAAALAFNSKQTAIVLAPIGILGVSWISKNSENYVLRICKNLIVYLVTFFLVTLMLNPYLWGEPLKAAAASWLARQNLADHQVADIREIASSQLLETPSQRVAAMFAQLYLTPPSFAEIGNYRDDTASSENAYLSIPGHNIGRGFIAGSILSILSIFGIVSAGTHIVSNKTPNKHLLLLLLLATLTQGIFLLFVLPLPWQRYYIPMMPFVSLWAAYGLEMISISVLESLQKNNQGPISPK
jgi:4-amino-4-deoxy-L-arabinose transferase-like glycosyltransferase